MTEQLEAATPQKHKRETRRRTRKRKMFDDVPEAGPGEDDALIGPGTDAK